MGLEVRVDGLDAGQLVERVGHIFDAVLAAKRDGEGGLAVGGVRGRLCFDCLLGDVTSNVGIMMEGVERERKTLAEP